MASSSLPLAAAAAPHQRLQPWLMVAACTVMVGMGFGAVVNIAVFLTPLGLAFGWPRGDLSFAYAAATVATGIGGVLMGHWADRLPIRRVALCGALVPAAGFWMLSRIDGLGELYLWHALLGLFGVGALLAPLNRLAGAWMPQRAGLAIGIVSAGGALGQGLMPFLARGLVLAGDWRQAYAVLALVYLLVLLPLALLLRDPPVQAPSPAAAAASAGAAPQRAWWRLAWLSVAVVFCCICMATPIVHVAALGTDVGLGGRASAGLLAVMMVAGAIGRIGFGRLGDRIGNLRTYMVAAAGQAALAFLFPYITTGAGLYVLSAVFGVVFSGAMTSFILCAREYAPAGRAGLAIGVIMLFGWVGMGLGGWQGGLFYDLCGSYEQGFGNASIGGLVTLLAIAVLWLDTRKAGARGLSALPAAARG